MTPIIKETIISIILLAAVVLFASFIKLIWQLVFIRIAKKTRTKLDLTILQAIQKPVYFTITIIGFFFVFKRITEKIPGIENLVIVKVGNGTFFIALVLIISYLAYAFIKAFCDWYLKEIAAKTKSKFDDHFIPLFSRIMKIVIVFIVLTIVLSHFKINITGFLATAGVASLAIALAAQDSLANMFASFTLLVDRPYGVGDRIELSSGEIGDVYEIGLRSTKILSFANTLIVIPNAEIAKSKIINYSYPDPKLAIRQKVSVAYGTDLDRVKKILVEVSLSHPEVKKEPGPIVYFTEFGNSSLNLLSICWIDSFKDKFRINDELNMQIKKRFEEEKIEIPFPQQDIHIKEAR